MFRSLFFGTPDFAVPSLDALHDISTVVGVVCQPDKPVGRGLVLTPPPVKARAMALGLPVVQPTKLRTGEFGAWVQAQNVDVALVIAYGRILPEDVLTGPRLGCVNVHASLLPKLRGAAPITWSIVRGDEETGITLMKMDLGMDTGDMLEQFPTRIGPDETAGELSARLASLGANAVRSGLPKYIRGEYTPVAQDHAASTLAPLLKKEDGRMRFDASAREIHDHVRGMSPWPCAFTTLGGKTVKVLATKRCDVQATGVPGEVVLADKSRVLVACGRGVIELLTVQLEGKKPMGASPWVAGRGVKTGDRFGT